MNSMVSAAIFCAIKVVTQVRLAPEASDFIGLMQVKRDPSRGRMCFPYKRIL
jgi:hypothetical protein